MVSSTNLTIDRQKRSMRNNATMKLDSVNSRSNLTRSSSSGESEGNINSETSLCDLAVISDRTESLEKRKSRHSKSNGKQLQDSPVIKERSKLRKPSPEVEKFVEPKLAEPSPSYTGLPLEEFPSTKIKKESLWPNKHKRALPDNVSQPELNHLLKTNLSDSLSEFSNERKSFLVDHVVDRTPQSNPIKEKDRESAPSSIRSSKRIKVISPRKSNRTNLAPTVNVTNESLNDTENDTKDNDDLCFACGELGIFICCDSCPKSFHFLCCDPPLEDIPEHNWHCLECSLKKGIALKMSWNHLGLFGPLLNLNEGRNPNEFRLPKNLRENTFIGVSTEANGSYTDSDMKPELSFAKLMGNQIPGFSWNEDLETDSLYNKDGKPFFCHRCGLSGLNHKTLIHCDYCPLVWHLDCLDEVICKAKNMGSKWRCPNHVESLLPSNLAWRQLKIASVVDPALHNQFLKIANSANLMIKFDDQPFFKTDTRPALLDYQSFQNDCYKFQQNGQSNTVIKIPEYFQSLGTESGIVAKASPKLSKVIQMTNDQSSLTKSVIYRIPQNTITLDFISKAMETRKLEKEVQVRFLGDEQDGFEGFLEFNEKVKQVLDNRDPAKRALDFEELVKAASIDFNPAPADHTQFNESEIHDLNCIKKLMEVKGRKALLQFLIS